MTIDLDPILAAAKPGDRITLGPGLYSCSGRSPGAPGPALPAGSSLVGVPGRTIVTLAAPPASAWTADRMVLSPLGDGCTVQDIIVDCGPAVPGWKCNGISMEGSGHTVTGCTTIRAWGWRTIGREGFGVHCTPRPGGPPSTGCQIINCASIAPQGDYVSGVVVNSGRIDGAVALGAHWNGVGFCRGAGGVTITNSTVWGATNGVYTDTGASVNVSVSNCHLVVTRRGICVRAQAVSPVPTDPCSVQGLSIVDCAVRLAPPPGAIEVAALELDNSVPQGQADRGDSVAGISEVTVRNLDILMLGSDTLQTGSRMVANICAGGPWVPSSRVGISGITLLNVMAGPLPSGASPWVWRNYKSLADRISVLAPVPITWSAA